MSGNCEKMVAIPPTTNQWPQPQVDDHQKVLMEKTAGEDQKLMQQQQQQQEALKCPRCDSSNTKFCYYNNYSLSQPRYFCKACKRYWTRGGTLRNVPVGGGCRKNKRLKRPITNSSTLHTASSTSNNSSASQSQPQIDTTTASTPLFYGSSDVNLPLFSRFASRISSSGFDLQHNNSLGLGFSSGISMSNNEAGDNNNGFFNSNNTLLSSYNSIFGGSTSTTPAMSSLLSSTLLQQKFMSTSVDSSNTFQRGIGLAPVEQLQMTSHETLKDVKVELGQNNRLLEWNGNGACQSQIQHVAATLYDPSLYWNNSPTAFGVWNDQPGSSLTSLI